MTRPEKDIMKSIKELYAFDYIPEIVISAFGDVCAVFLSDVNKMLTAETIALAEPIGIEIGGER